MTAVNRTSHCLHQLIEDQVRRTPGAPAVAFEGERLTYAELDRQASEVARRLLLCGAAPEVRVALFMERSASLVVGLLGILKAGAAYVPIDPGYPEARIAFLLEDAGADIVLTENALVRRLPAGVPRVLCIERVESSARATRAAPAARAENLAYVIYTSGSTGRPKGVCIEHRHIANYVLGIAERLRLEPGMHHAMVSTIAADLGNTVLFPSLATGGCLHVISQARAENPGLLAEYFRAQRIDVLKITPSHLAALQAGAAPESVMPRERLILGGEPCSLGRIAALRALAPECEIHNHYGPTETTVGVLTYRVPSPLPSTRTGTVPLGSPLPNSRVHVLDAHGSPSLPGEQGEIFIGGAGVARGYLGRPELTAERFIADPLDPAARVYRTGDLGRRLPDGGIEFCGRTDDQVKLDGHRVELGEIEHALREHGGIREAVVVARETAQGAKQLVAYLVAERADQPLWAEPAVYVLPDGAPVAHLNRNETDYIHNEIFVLQAYRRHGITIADGDCIVDAGANIGLFTVFASRLARGLRIVALEPNPAAFACLSANAKAWGNGVTCLPCGLSSEEKTADLTFFEGMSLLSGFYADRTAERSVVETYVRNQQAASATGGEWSVELEQLIDARLQASTVRAQLRTLSQVMAEQRIERIDLLKVNVEKSELDVLRGLAAHDWPKIRQMVIEVDRSDNLAPITSLLEQNGFETVVEQDPLLARTELCYVYAMQRGATRRLTGEQAAAAPMAPPAGDAGLLAPASLRKYLNDRLPRHMVPQAFVLLERLPLTANGKVDRAALPAPGAAPAAGLVQPRTQTEKALAAIWSELLEIQDIGVNDDFFDLGGKSLLAIRMMALIRDECGVDLQLRNLLDRPTVAGLAEIVDALAWKQKAEAGRPLDGERQELTL